MFSLCFGNAKLQMKKLLIVAFSILQLFLLQVENKIGLAGGVEASVKDDQFSIVGQDMKSVPTDIGNYAKGVKKLDFSWNCLK